MVQSFPWPAAAVGNHSWRTVAETHDQLDS